VACPLWDSPKRGFFRTVGILGPGTICSSRDQVKDLAAYEPRTRAIRGEDNFRRLRQKGARTSGSGKKGVFRFKVKISE
jgi:hypothetical protein